MKASCETSRITLTNKQSRTNSSIVRRGVDLFKNPDFNWPGSDKEREMAGGRSSTSKALTGEVRCREPLRYHWSNDEIVKDYERMKPLKCRHGESYSECHGQKKRQILPNIQRLTYIRHIMRENGFRKDFDVEEIEGRRKRGRPAMS
ncbi:hypothetical protein LAZ67_1004964 [Cordylochernes scorpioides]|uniref:Uncharacterized protein n=1 Tax=Cordylochernes scorpioides TaxID=51811 RepID=A0ABY6K2P4_9ARAC|nr:hypothetical protein LAZ67_1004964 [Cordylochernes scorpioides]